MQFFKTISVAGALLLAFPVQAGLFNISTNNLQSRDSEASGCAIIESGGPTLNGQKVLVVFSESNEENSDSSLRVQNLKGTVVYTNDDWRGNRYLNGNLLGGTVNDVTTAYTTTVGRTPNRNTDSAILVAFNPGEAICAFSRENKTTNLKSVSISIADVTALATKALAIDQDDVLKRISSVD